MLVSDAAREKSEKARGATAYRFALGRRAFCRPAAEALALRYFSGRP